MSAAIHPTATVAPSAKVAHDVTIGAYAIINERVEIGAGSFVGPFSILGEPTSDFYSNSAQPPAWCRIGANALIRSHSVIYAGAEIGADFKCGHRVTIREGSVIGSDCRVGTLSDLQGNLRIGSHVRLHSSVHIGMFSVIEDFAWVFPYVVLTNDPHPPSDTCTRGPTVRRLAVIATHSVLMPGITVGEGALVGAMSLVNRDVPPETLVVGVPARPAGSVRDIRCEDGRLPQLYPWPYHFRRGYPPEAAKELLRIAGAEE